MPSWSRLCKLSAPQAGYFTAAQAQSAGFSPQLLQYYLQKALVQRTHRGVFHLTQYARHEHEDLIGLWLWSRREGVFSHETALLLLDLCDAAPERCALTMPSAWRKRRVRLPLGASVYYADLPEGELLSRGPLLYTGALRTLVDCVKAQVDGEVVERAIRHAVKRKLITRARLQRALRAAPDPVVARLRARAA